MKNELTQYDNNLLRDLFEIIYRPDLTSAQSLDYISGNRMVSCLFTKLWLYFVTRNRLIIST